MAITVHNLGPVERYRQHLPEHLREKYQAALDDPQLSALRQENALMTMRIKMLLENLDREVLTEDDIALQILATFPDIEEHTVHRLAALMATYLPESFIDHRTFRRLSSLVHTYKTQGDDIKATQALNNLFDFIEDGERIGDVWDDIQRAMEQRRKLIETEEKRQERLSQMLPIEKVVLLMEVVIDALKQSVTRYVQDQDTKKYIFLDAEQLHGRILTLGGDPAENAKPVVGRRRE